MAWILNYRRKMQKDTRNLAAAPAPGSGVGRDGMDDKQLGFV